MTIINTISMKVKIAFIIATFLILSSCTKDNLDNLDYFAFGDAYGMCQRDCATFFLLKDKKLYSDDMDYYMETSLKFKSEVMSSEKYNLAKELIENFPDYLLQNPNKTFGCPDCIDQGGIHIEIQEKGLTKRWHFDTTISNLPSEIQDYVLEISNVIEELK